jgi:hypothetical protein
MSDKPDIRSFCNELKPSYGAAWQVDRLTGEVYPDWDALLKSVRSGSIVEVVEGFLLAPVTGRPSARRDAMLDRLDAIKDRKGILHEVSTGHRSNNQSQCNRIVARAYEMIASSGRGRRSAQNGALSKGRPRKQWTKEQLEAAERIWFSTRYKTRHAACLAIQALNIPIGIPTKEPGDPSEIAKIGVQKKRRKPKSYVYFIQDGETVKIGHSHSPKSVIKALKRGNHRELILLATGSGGQPREVALHKKFAKFRLHRRHEWFTLSPQISKYIAGLKRRNKK